MSAWFLDSELSTYFSVAPYDVVVMGDNTYTQGQQLQLNCSSKGGPQLEYTWIFSNDVIPNENTSTLTIDNVNTTNGGDYTCNVTNNAGVDNDTITVYSELQYNVDIILFAYCNKHSYSCKQSFILVEQNEYKISAGIIM